MRNRKILRVAIVVGLVGAMMGAKDPGCESKGRVKSDRPASEKVVDPKKHRTAKIEVKGTGPYDVFVHVQQANGKGGSDQTREKVAGGTYTQTLDYTSGTRLRIRVSVTGHTNDKFSCKIIDGPVAVTWHGPDRGKVYCGAVTTG